MDDSIVFRLGDVVVDVVVEIVRNFFADVGIVIIFGFVFISLFEKEKIPAAIFSIKWIKLVI